MTRISSDARILLASQLRTLDNEGRGTAHYLWLWASKEGRSLLGKVPAKSTLQSFVKKSREVSTLLDMAKDRPRDQSNRQGKAATVTPTQRSIVLRKAKDIRRTRSRRRTYQLAREKHGERQMSPSTIKGILRTAGLRFKRCRSTIAMKPHHIQFRLRMAEKWVKKKKEFWRNFIFSDEKTFRLNGKRHQQNDGLWVSVDEPDEHDLKELTYVQDRYSGSVSVWAGVSFYGKLEIDVLESTQDGAHYLKNVIQGIVKPFMEKEKRVKVFQQDGAGLHRDAKVIDSLNRHLGEGKWTAVPPRPCKKTDRAGNPIKVVKTCKTGKARNYQVDSVHC